MTFLSANPNPIALVHHFHPRVQACKTVIALTPLALQDCTVAHLEPTTIDDHVDRRELMKDQTEYLAWQLDWFSRLDQFGTNGNGTARAAAQLLKPAVDSVVIKSRLMVATVRNLRPTRILYSGPTGDANDVPRTTDLQFRHRLGDRPLLFRLLPLVGEFFDLECDMTTAAAPQIDSNERNPLARDIRRKVRIQLNVGGIRSRKGPSTLMLWMEGYGAATLARRTRREHQRLLVLDRGNTTGILEPRCFGFRSLSSPISVRPFPPEGALTGPTIEMLDEIDHWAGLPGAGQVLRSRLDFYLLGICPSIDRAAKPLADSMNAHQVHSVAAALGSSLEELTATVAANRTGIETTLYQHGDHAFSFDFWLATETQNFKRMVCSDPTVPGDLEAAGRLYGVPTPVFQLDSPRVVEMRKVGMRKSKRRRLPVCYVPTPYVGDSYIFGGSYFDDTWYFRWQMLLLEFMKDLDEAQFIWKALPSGNESPDPIPKILTARSITNVTYETRPLPKVISEAGRIIIDFPSTPLYEAVHHRKPILALHFPRFAVIRESAKKVFGPVLRSCENESEGLEAVNSFLKSGPSDFVVDQSWV